MKKEKKIYNLHEFMSQPCTSRSFTGLPTFLNALHVKKERTRLTKPIVDFMRYPMELDFMDALWCVHIQCVCNFTFFSLYLDRGNRQTSQEIVKSDVLWVLLF
jgi:hypothetical protein